MILIMGSCLIDFHWEHRKFYRMRQPEFFILDSTAIIYGVRL